MNRTNALRLIALVLLVTILTVAHTPATFAAATIAAAPNDLAVQDLALVQAIPNEPLVLGKATVARVTLSVPTDKMNARVALDVNGKAYEYSGALSAPQTTVTVKVDEPRVLAPVKAQVTVTGLGGFTDSDTSNNSKSVTYTTVQTANKITAFFLPVDWTPEEQTKYKYEQNMKSFLQDAGDFLLGAYPLPPDQLVTASTMTPHMLSTFERTITDSNGKDNTRSLLALYAGISIVGRRYRPDADIVVAVLPPEWFRKHGLKAVGMALHDVVGTITSEFDPNDPTTAAHETGHLFSIGEDYDCSADTRVKCNVSPNHPGILVTVPGYWIQRSRELKDTSTNHLWSFMSAGVPDTDFYWTDARLYEYLMAKFSIPGGNASQPTIVAATPAWRVSDDGNPIDMTGNTHRFEPDEPVYVSVGGLALKAGSRLEVRLYRGSAVAKTKTQTTVAGNKWYAFMLGDQKELKEGQYRADVYLDGQLVKSTDFLIQASK